MKTSSKKDLFYLLLVALCFKKNFKLSLLLGNVEDYGDDDDDADENEWVGRKILISNHTFTQHVVQFESQVWRKRVLWPWPMSRRI